MTATAQPPEERQPADFYLTILDAIRDPVVVVDPDMRCIYLNKVARDSFKVDEKGRGRNCLCYHVLRNFTTSCWEQGEECPVREAFATGQSIPVVKEMCLFPGLKRTYEITAVPIRNEAGAISWVVEVLRDITASLDHMHLKELSNKIEKAKREWETTMDCVQEFVILTDAEQRIKRCNKPLVDFLGLTFTEVLDRELPLFLHSHGFRQEVCLLAKREFEYSHQASGRTFTLHTYPLATKEGAMTVTTLHDISKHKETAALLEEKNRQIRRTLTDLQATQAQLLQQEKMASVGQLAAGVAHEINNPMGFVTSNINTLAKYQTKLREFLDLQDQVLSRLCRNSPDTLQRLAEQRRSMKIDFILQDTSDLIAESTDGVERVKKIVMNLKNFSRVDQAERARANINECLDDTITIAWNELKYTCTIHKEYGDLPALMCHPQQLNQVFMNLLLNAAQAMTEPGVITIRTWHDKEALFIAISDTGCGMAPETIPHVFEPFFTTKNVDKGTGLGLSISYDIITKQHNGTITIQSEPGKGSTFTIRLPLSNKEEK